MALIEQDLTTNAHDEYLYVAQYGSVWTQVGAGKLNINGSGTHVQSATLATNGTNPAICWVEYVDNENNRSLMTITPQLYCKQWNGSAWNTMGSGSLNQNSSDYVNDPSLAYYNGQFYVAWTERSPNGWPQVLVHTYNGSGWSQVGSGSLNNITSTGIAYHPVLAVDGTAAPPFDHGEPFESLNLFRRHPAVRGIRILQRRPHRNACFRHLELLESCRSRRHGRWDRFRCRGGRWHPAQPSSQRPRGTYKVRPRSR